MGNRHPGGPSVHAHVPSPSMPGIRTCVSDPLDPYCSFEEYFDELLALLHEPLQPWDVPALKEVEVQSVGPCECVVRVILDSESVKELELPVEPHMQKELGKPDLVRLWLRLTWDRQKREMVIHTNDTSSGETHSTVLIKFLKDPFRIETLYTTNKYNTDISILAWVAENQWLRPVIAEMTKRKVKISRNVDSPMGSGDMVAISEPLDEYLDYHTLFREYIGVLKSVGVGVEEVSESEFEVTITNPMACGSEKIPLKRLIRYDEVKGEVVSVTSCGHRLIETNYTVIHRSPLRVETWTESNGKRLYKRMNSELLQYNLDHIIKKHDEGGAKEEESDCSIA